MTCYDLYCIWILLLIFLGVCWLKECLKLYIYHIYTCVCVYNFKSRWLYYELRRYRRQLTYSKDPKTLLSAIIYIQSTVKYGLSHYTYYSTTKCDDYYILLCTTQEPLAVLNV